MVAFSYVQNQVKLCPCGIIVGVERYSGKIIRDNLQQIY